MIAVLAETGRLTTPGLPEAGARRFAEIGDTARAGLTEMRRLLGVLREDAAAAEEAADATDAGRTARSLADGLRQPQPGLAQLTELVDAARDASLAGTRLIISGPVVPLDPGVELAAYRIVQEALTNARRHAPGRGGRRRAALLARVAAAARQGQRARRGPADGRRARAGRDAGAGVSVGGSLYAGSRRAAGSSSRPCCRDRDRPGCPAADGRAG